MQVYRFYNLSIFNFTQNGHVITYSNPFIKVNSVPYRKSKPTDWRQSKGDPQRKTFVETVFQPQQADLKQAQVTTVGTVNTPYLVAVLDHHAQAYHPHIGQAEGNE